MWFYQVALNYPRSGAVAFSGQVNALSLFVGVDFDKKRSLPLLMQEKALY